MVVIKRCKCNKSDIKRSEEVSSNHAIHLFSFLPVSFPSVYNVDIKIKHRITNATAATRKVKNTGTVGSSSSTLPLQHPHQSQPLL